MGSEFGPWGIVKTEIFYNNKKIEDFTCESEENVKIIKFEISTIERQIFERLFRVFFKYVYHDNLAKTYETELFLDVICFITMRTI